MDRHSRSKMPGVVAYVCMPLLLSAVCGIILYFGLAPVAEGLKRASNQMLNSGNEYFLGDTPTVLKEEQDGGEGQTLIPETETQVQEIKKQVVEEPNIGDQYGQLVCERIGINSPIYFGDNPNVLLQGIGTYPVSWIPGCGHTTLMSGHNDMSLKTLGDVEVGDRFTLTTSYGTFEYQVSDFKIVDENDIQACRLDSDTEQVVIYTCYPFYKVSGRKTERFFVYLEKLSGPEIELTHYFLKD